jgi:hypothetical protein
MYDKALIIQGFVVSGVPDFCCTISGSFPHLFGNFRNLTSQPALLPSISTARSDMKDAFGVVR